MSEEFDKEAEREKLREKLADEEEKRSATQRMSELLLQGATMTNQHCDNCGDPLFRDNGETFCPTCASAEGQTTEAEGSQPSETSTPDAATRAASQPRNGAQQRPGDAADGQLSQLPDGAEVRPQPGTATQTPDRNPETRRPQPGQQEPPTPSERADTQGDPRVELRRAVTETARNATAATDPRTARAWLEASKEAAEALAALE
ncbi:MAG: Sjogren's syndrome/scleroderma autoantigen 1 family protein [Halolamina sp.]